MKTVPLVTATEYWKSLSDIVHAYHSDAHSSARLLHVAKQFAELVVPQSVWNVLFPYTANPVGIVMDALDCLVADVTLRAESRVIPLETTVDGAVDLVNVLSADPDPVPVESNKGREPFCDAP